MQNVKLSRSDDEARVLAQAVAKIADHWGLTNQQLGRMLGLSAPTVSRLLNGHLMLDRHSKAFELAQYLVRLFRGLDAIMGSDDAAARSWLRTENLDLGSKPLDAMGRIKGLVSLCDYVDGFRARV